MPLHIFAKIGIIAAPDDIAMPLTRRDAEVAVDFGLIAIKRHASFSFS